MIQYRPFLNSDPPAIAEIWRSQPPSHAFIQTMTAAVLDDMVYSKPFFDRNGLILAVDGDKPVGFVHAGFGPNAEFSALDHSQGTTALLFVSPHRERESIARELLSHSERYLSDHGATRWFGGATRTLAPFYLGLYGGGQLSGISASDTASATLFRQADYHETAHARVFRRDLTGFRPPVDRELMQVRRQYQLVKQTEAMPQTWWEACEVAALERLEFVLLPKTKGPPAAEATFWDIEPLASSWGVHAMGLMSLEISACANECAIAVHFIGEIFRQLQGYGITLVEFQLRADQTLAIEACQKLGFKEIDQGLLFEKPASA